MFEVPNKFATGETVIEQFGVVHHFVIFATGNNIVLVLVYVIPVVLVQLKTLSTSVRVKFTPVLASSLIVLFVIALNVGASLTQF